MLGNKSTNSPLKNKNYRRKLVLVDMNIVLYIQILRFESQISQLLTLKDDFLAPDYGQIKNKD